MKKYLLFVFSNKTHFETALPIINFLKEKYKFIGVFNYLNSIYSQGLKNYMNKYSELFEDIYIIEGKKGQIDLIVKLLKLKKYLLKIINIYNIKSSIQFIEGGIIDWLVIGVLKEKNIKTNVLQWAITGEPSFYDKMKSNKKKFFIKNYISKIIKTLLRINYPTMKYLGDGNADHILTMGEFWTKQFLSYHNYPEKFITVGNPRFLDLLKLRKIENKNNILFITGAGTSLYGYLQNQHLKDILEIYTAYSNANVSAPLIHKIHPRDIYKREILELSKQYKNIIVEFEKSTFELLKETGITIVIRSTVGLEALLSGSKLIVYNNNNQEIGFNYAKYGLAEEIKSIDELSFILKNKDLIPNVDKNKLEFFLKTDNVLEDIENVIKN